MRIPIRTSRLAIWAWRLGAFTLPLLIFALVLRVLGIMEPVAFEAILAIGAGLGLIALICAILAYIRIWNTGDLGWTKASLGLLAGVIALAPLGVWLGFALRYPSTDDITTRATDLPALALRPDDQVASLLDSGGLARAFPGVVSRAYPLAPAQLYALVEGLVGERDWPVLRRIGPVANDGVGLLDALHTSLIGRQSEIVFVVEPDPRGARINLRAASVRDLVHDLGVNGRIADAFLNDLDDVVTIFERDGSALIEQARGSAISDPVAVDAGD